MSNDSFDFSLKQHLGKDGSILGYTQKDINGNKFYIGSDGSLKGIKIKDHISNTSHYFDSGNKYLGSSFNQNGDGHNFMKSDGNTGYYPKMLDYKDPDFHSKTHKLFSDYREDLLRKLR